MQNYRKEYSCIDEISICGIIIKKENWIHIYEFKGKADSIILQQETTGDILVQMENFV